jgi:hypothetical protein
MTHPSSNLVALLRELQIEMRHALTFIRSREKMHPVGVEQYEDALRRLGEHLDNAPAEPRYTAQMRCPRCAHSADVVIFDSGPVPRAVETEAPLPLKYHVSEEGWMVCDECGDEAIEVIKCVGCARTTIGRLPARTAPPETKATYPRGFSPQEVSECLEAFMKKWLAEKASAPTTCDTKCFGWPRCECGRRMP